MLKALALSLTVVIFLASGFTFAPADPVAKQWPGLNRSETFTSEKLVMVPVNTQLIIEAKIDRLHKPDRQEKPNS